MAQMAIGNYEAYNIHFFRLRWPSKILENSVYVCVCVWKNLRIIRALASKNLHLKSTPMVQDGLSGLSYIGLRLYRHRPATAGEFVCFDELLQLPNDFHVFLFPPF